MRQAVMTAPGKIEFREVPRPVPQPDEVLVRIRRIGICGSDIHVYHGLHPYTSYPVVQGHEVSGTVEETGSAVRDFQAGDPVVFLPQATCGTCYPCRHGMFHICDDLKVMGFQTGGAGQDFFCVRAAMAIKVPGSICLDNAAMIEPLAVGIHALARYGDIRDKNVVVLGAGTIGNLAGQAALASGANVLITDISEYKLEKARNCGISHAVNPHRLGLGEAIQGLFGLDKADLIVECAGSQLTIQDAVRHARKGSTIVAVGVFGKIPRVDVGLIQDRELSLIGSLMYREPDYEQAIEMMAKGAIHLEELITHRFAFEDYPAAYRTINEAEGRVMKVMLSLD